MTRDETGLLGPLIGLLEGGSGRRAETRALMRDVARALRLHLGLQVGFVSRIDTVSRTLLAVDAAPGAAEAAGVSEGRVDPVEATFCHGVLQGRIPPVLNDAMAHPAASAALAASGARVGGYVNVPVRIGDGTLYGTICCFSAEPGNGLGERDLELMNAVAELLGRRLDRDLRSERDGHDFSRRIALTLEGGRVRFVRQPIVALRDRRRFASEILCRFELFPEAGPQTVIGRAHESGMGDLLEKAILAALLRRMREAPEEEAVPLFVNLTPALLQERSVVDTLGAMGRPVVVEFTEHTAYAADAATLRAVAEARASGLRVAIDDFGTGYSSFDVLMKVRPDFIKLDRSLVAQLDGEPAVGAMIAGLAAFAAATGARLIAEGVETEENALRIAALGVELGQGWALAEPTEEP